MKLLPNIFRILPDERPKLIVFSLLAALLQAGLVIGIASSDSLFLSGLGADKLPYIYLFLPLVMLAYAPIYSVLLHKLGIERLFVFTLVLLTAGGIVFGLLFQMLTPAPPWLLYSVKFYTGLWFIALYTLFWNFADDYFAVLDGKRLFGLIAAGASFGGIIGAGLVSVLSRFIEPGMLYFVWSIFCLLAIPVFAAIRRHPKLDFGLAGVDSGQSPLTMLVSVGRAFRQSRFALYLTLICFALVNLGNLLEFLSYGVFQEGRNSAEVAVFLGQLYAIAAALTLFINLFCFSFIVGRIGVNNVALITPIAFLGAFIAFYLAPGLGAALVGFYVLQTLFVSIEYNNINLLINGLATGLRKHLRTFIEALAEPCATAFSGLILILFVSQIGSDGIARIGIIAGVGAVTIAFAIRNDYARSLATNLRLDWLDLSPTGFAQAAEVSTASRNELLKRALDSDYEDRILATELLWRLNDPMLRVALLSLLETARAEDADRLSPIIAGLLTNADNATIAKILLWLENRSASCPAELMGEFISKGAIPVRQLEAWQKSSEIPHRALTAVAHWHKTRLGFSQQAINEVHSLIAVPGQSREWALRALGDFQHPSLLGEILPWIDDADPNIRIAALRSIAKLAFGLNTLPQALIKRISEAHGKELEFLLEIVARIGDTTAVIPILSIAARFPLADSRLVEEALMGMGAKATPAVVRVLRDFQASFRSRIIAMRILAQIAPPQVVAMAPELIDKEFRRSDEVATADQLDFILEVLSLSGTLPDLNLIRTSLRRSNARDRANAVETIQQNIPQYLFRQLTPLIEIASLQQKLTPA